MDEISQDEIFCINQEIKKIFSEKIIEYKNKNKNCNILNDIAQSTGLSKSAVFRIINCKAGNGNAKSYEPFDYKKICVFFDSALKNETQETWEKIFQLFTFYYENKSYYDEDWFLALDNEEEDEDNWQ